MLLSFIFQPLSQKPVPTNLSSLTMTTFSNTLLQPNKSTFRILFPVFFHFPFSRAFSDSFLLSFYLHKFYSSFKAWLYYHFFCKDSTPYSAPSSFLCPLNFNNAYYPSWTLHPYFHWCYNFF